MKPHGKKSNKNYLQQKLSGRRDFCSNSKNRVRVILIARSALNRGTLYKVTVQWLNLITSTKTISGVPLHGGGGLLNYGGQNKLDLEMVDFKATL